MPTTPATPSARRPCAHTAAFTSALASTLLALAACQDAAVPTAPSVSGTPTTATTLATSATSPPALQVSAGGSHTCALTGARTILCWGGDDYGQVSNAPTSGTFVQVSAGHSHSCAVTDAGALNCWGYDGFGQVSGTPTSGTFSEVSAGQTHTCALTAAGAITCWGAAGFRYGPYLDTPSGDGYAQLTAGNTFTCALTSAGTITCWGGTNAAGQTSPVPAGAITQFDAGGLHGCAVVAGALECWGSNLYGQVSGAPTTGTFIQASAGALHSCALTDARAVRCWGYNLQGQATVPLALRPRLAVAIDVLPGTSPNVIALGDPGMDAIPVAVLSTATFDASGVNRATMTLRDEAAFASGAGAKPTGYQLRDVQPKDGRRDLVLLFKRADVVSAGGLTTASTQLVLEGAHADGRLFRGADAVQVTP